MAAKENDFLKARRKLIVTVLIIAVGTGLLIAGKVDAAHWVEVTTWIGGLYLGANVTKGAVNLITKRKDQTPYRESEKESDCT